MSINIRKALPSDISGVISLLREFAEFENLSQYVDITEDKLADVVFGSGSFVDCLVAESSNSLVAYAILYPSFSTFRGQKGMYLEDIFITQSHRSSGLGEKMLKAIARLTSEKGCERLDLMVLDWNMPAVRFYEKHGAIRDDEERHLKFVDIAFEKLLAES